MAGEVSTYLTAGKQAAFLYAAQNGGKGQRDKGEGQYGIQGQQIGRDCEIVTKRYSKTFCFLCCMSVKSSDHIMN